MRTITVADRTFTVNPLRGKDIRELREQGVDPLKGNYSLSDGMDKVFVIAGFDLAEVDEMPFPDILELHKAIMHETFGNPAEEKNS